MNAAAEFERLKKYNDCFIQTKRNATFIITTVYEAIPQTLLLNFIVWILILLIFSILRKRVWNYGRLGIVNRNWMTVMFPKPSSLPKGIDSCGETETPLTSSPDVVSNGREMQRNMSVRSNKLVDDNGIFSWISITCRMRDNHILEQCGPDAIHYLSFQRHLMIVMAVLTVIAIGIILPLNFHGTLIADPNNFARTTISNLQPDSPMLWFHVVAVILYVPLVVFVMRRSSGRNATRLAPTRTIMVTNILPAHCVISVIRTYMNQMFNNPPMTDIQLAYDVQKLTLVVEKYKRIRDARRYCQQNMVMMREGRCTCRQMDALEYYEHKEQQLRHRVDKLRTEAFKNPLGIAFISMETVKAATYFVNSFEPSTFFDWRLRFAPAPSDIFWENLTLDTLKWFIKWFIVNLILFLVLFFLTTPIIVMKILGSFNVYVKMTAQANSMISQFMSTLLLIILAATMPAMVSYSEKLLSHFTRSKLNLTIMTKSFGYLLFMILILPSLGLTSAQAFLEWTVNYSDQNTFRWECIFLPGKGAFYVNYVITAAFIGTAFELMRLPELIVYAWELCTAKSRAENKHIQKYIINEFPFGIQYAWTLLVFTIATVYSIACPLIMPFAMIYFGLKHFVDRHNLIFAYAPTNMISQGGGKIHFTAISFTKVSVILLLIIMAALTSVRSGSVNNTRSIILIIALNVTFIMFAFTSKIKKCTMKPPNIEEPEPTESTPTYVADVLVQHRVSFQEDLTSCESTA